MSNKFLRVQIFTILFLSIFNIYSDGGGKAAGAFFGGLAAGIILNTATQPRYVEREVIYVESPRNQYYNDYDDDDDDYYDSGFE